MPSFGQNMDWIKSKAIGEVGTEIGAYRLNFITDLPGQEAIYQAKRDEAARYITEGRPADLTDFPLLRAEEGITAPTASDLADLWIGMDIQWRNIAADLEKIRMTAVKSINAATDRAGVQSALDAFRASMAAYTPPT